jgi:hypothetical protein
MASSSDGPASRFASSSARFLRSAAARAATRQSSCDCTPPAARASEGAARRVPSMASSSDVSSASSSASAHGWCTSDPAGSRRLPAAVTHPGGWPRGLWRTFPTLAFSSAAACDPPPAGPERARTRVPTPLPTTLVLARARTRARVATLSVMRWMSGMMRQVHRVMKPAHHSEASPSQESAHARVSQGRRAGARARAHPAAAS